MAKKFPVRSFLTLARSFVAVNGIIDNTIDGTFGHSPGDLWPMFRNLPTVVTPPTSHAVGPMLPNIGAATEG
jgi:hypothetical protein